MFSRLRQSSNNGENQNVGSGAGGYGNNSNAYNSNTQSNPNNYNSNANTNSSSNYSSNGNNNSNSYESSNTSNNNSSSSYNHSNSNSNSNSYDNYSSGNGHNRTGSNTDSKNSQNNNKKISNNSQQTGYGNDQTRKEPSETGQSTASSLFSSSNAGAQSNVSAATSVSSGWGNSNSNNKGSPKKASYSQLGSKMDTIQDEGNNVGTNTYGSSTVNNDREATSARRETLYEDANEHLANGVSGNNKQSNNHTSNNTQNIQSWQQSSAHAPTKGTNNGNNTGSGRDTASNSGTASKAAYSSSNNGKSSNDTHQGNQKNSRESANHNNNANSYGNNQSSMAGNQSTTYGNSKNESNNAYGNSNTSNKPINKSQRNLSSSGRSNSGKSASGRSNSGKGGRNSPRQNDQHGGSKGATTYNSNGTAQHLDSHARTSSNTGYGSSTTSHNSTGNRNTNNSQDPIAQAGDFNDPNADVVFLSSESGSGSTRSPVVRFRIHSVNLRVHSPVLTKNVEQESRQEHQLEEDAATLKHLFSLMYNRDSPILEPNDWQMVLRLARCAQKYDVVRAKERAIAYFTKNEQSGALSPFMTYAFAVQYNLPTLEAAAAERSVRYDVNKIPELIFNMMGFTAFQRLASFHAKRQEYYQDMLNALSIDPKEVADQCYQTGGVCVVTPLARLKQTLAWPRQVGRDATKRAPEPADVLRKIITEIGQIDCGTCAKALVEAGLAIQHTLETLPSYSHDESS